MNLAESESQTQANSKSHPRLCAHCRNALQATQDKFCCKGCEFVFASIKALGLSAFYSMRSDSAGVKIQALKSYAYLGDVEVTRQICVSLPNGLTRVRFHLPTLHCAACVWILEKLPFVVSGIRSSRVSFASGQIEIEADQREISPEKIAAVLHSIGYPPVPAIATIIEAENRREKRSMLIRIGIAAVCAANTMMLADSLFQSFFTGMQPHFLALFTWASALIALPAVTYAAYPFYRAAIGSLITARAHIDLPISIAIIATYLADLTSVINGSAHVYFDSITCLIFLLLVARYLQSQSLARSRASSASTWDLFPARVRVCVGDDRHDKPLTQLVPGDIIEVQPQERVPADAFVVAGSSSVDDSFISGESLPKQVAIGDVVLAGSINVEGVLQLATQAVGESTRLGKILAAINHTQARGSKIEDLANRLSGYFVATVLALAAVTFVYWYVTVPQRAFSITVSLLVITCPCALGLAIPVTLAAALAQAKKSRLFIQSADAMHTLACAKHFYFDKTGTLTSGKLRVSRCVGTDVVLQITKALTQATISHPVSVALQAYCHDAVASKLTSVVHLPGKGVIATADLGDTYSLGSVRWFLERNIKIDQKLHHQIENWIEGGIGVSLLERNGECIGAFGLVDQIAPQALDTVKDLQRHGKRVLILSGDAQRIVNKVAQTLHIAREDARGDLYPEQKAQVVAADKTVRVVVGDGLNDAQAMQSADVGVGVSGGIETVVESADIFVARDGLQGFLAAFHGSLRVRKVIRTNLLFSLVYNVVAALVAVSGHVTPLTAAVFMPLSSLVVIFNSSLQCYFRPTQES